MGTAVQQIDLNCDLGEYENLGGVENDAQIMPFISSCNIACGGHAGSPKVMDHTIELANQHGVAVGAHPAYPDPVNFGRQVVPMAAGDLRASCELQIQTLYALIDKQGGKMSHVKPHGALYNKAAVDFALAEMLAKMVAAIDPGLQFYGLANSAMQQACKEQGVQFVAEGFIDRAYSIDGLLVPRTTVGAVISDTDVMVERVINWLTSGQLTCLGGAIIEVAIDTLCLHGDHPQAAQIAAQVAKALASHNITIKAPA